MHQIRTIHEINPKDGCANGGVVCKHSFLLELSWRRLFTVSNISTYLSLK